MVIHRLHTRHPAQEPVASTTFAKVGVGRQADRSDRAVDSVEPELSEPDQPSPEELAASEAANARRVLADSISLLTAKLDSNLELARRQRAEAAEVIVCLAVDVAEKLIREEIKANRHDLQQAVVQALPALPATGELIVRIHPEDAALLDEDNLAAPDSIELSVNSGLERGSFELERGEISVTSDWPEVLKTIRNQLLDAVVASAEAENAAQ